MSEAAAEATIRIMIAEVVVKLEEAVSIAKAARTCAEDGSIRHAVQILMDYEGFAGDARDLFQAALSIRRHLLDAST